MKTPTGDEIMDMKHTPALPLRIDEYRTVVDANGECVVLSGFSVSTGPRNHQAEEATAYIVHCVNTYADLSRRHAEAVRALENLIAAVAAHDEANFLAEDEDELKQTGKAVDDAMDNARAVLSRRE